MILVVAATEIEIRPLKALTVGENVRFLVAGVGPLETAVRLTRHLAGGCEGIVAVVNVGVAGGYITEGDGPKSAILDLYLAETEVFGDLGLCYPDRVEPLAEELTGGLVLPMDRNLLDLALQACADSGIPTRKAGFVTVAGASATRARGTMLAATFDARCENMEGAAVVRVCRDFSLPVLEIRCISNLVEDRNPANWKLREACEKVAPAAAAIIKILIQNL